LAIPWPGGTYQQMTWMLDPDSETSMVPLKLLFMLLYASWVCAYDEPVRPEYAYTVHEKDGVVPQRFWTLSDLTPRVLIGRLNSKLTS
jgi:hypothetical protein